MLDCAGEQWVFERTYALKYILLRENLLTIRFPQCLDNDADIYTRPIIIEPTASVPWVRLLLL